MRIKFKTPALFFILLALLVVPLSLGFGGFDDDTGDVCLGWEDPFCSNDECSGGCGGQSTCWECRFVGGTTGFNCKKNLNGRQTCTVTYSSTSQGTEIRCDVSGGTCVN